MPHTVPPRSQPYESNPPHPAAELPDGSARLAVLPHPRFWLLWAALLCAAVLTLGLVAKNLPGFAPGEFSLDQELSRNHNGALTAVAMVLNYVFSPLGGVLIIASVALALRAAGKSWVNAFAFGGVAAAGWLSSQWFKLLVDRQRPNPALLFDPLAPETLSLIHI